MVLTRLPEDQGVRLCFEQPSSIATPAFETQQPQPTTDHSVARVSTWLEYGRDKSVEFVRSRSSTISSAIRPWTASGSKRRPHIGAPTDFRRVTEPLPTRRRSFRRLELSIYQPSGRLSPLPDFSTSEWEEKLPQLRAPAPAFLRYASENLELNRNFSIKRKPLSMPEPTTRPFSGGLDDTFRVEDGPGPTLDTGDSRHNESDETDPIPISLESHLSEEPSAGLRSQVQSSTSSTPIPLGSSYPLTGSQTESLILPRKSSLRRSKEDTVEVAIRELNTIVEEHRLTAMTRIRNEAGLEPQSPTHIPAVAPSMKVRARSETLSDIGSAFRIPMSTKPLPTQTSPKQDLTVQQIEGSRRTESTESQPPSTTTSITTLPTMVPVTILPQEPVSAEFKLPTTRSRISTWLRRSASSNPAMSSPPAQFYQLTSPPIMVPSHRRSDSTVSTFSEVSSVTSSFLTSCDDVWSPASNTHHSRTATITSTIATSILSPLETPDEPLPPRLSISKTRRSLRRTRPKRGLSIETTASAATGKVSEGLTRPPPPPYQKDDPLTPTSGEASPITPGPVGMAF